MSFNLGKQTLSLAISNHFYSDQPLTLNALFLNVAVPMTAASFSLTHSEFNLPDSDFDELIRILLRQMGDNRDVIRAQGVRLLNTLGVDREPVIAAMVPLLMDGSVSMCEGMGGGGIGLFPKIHSRV